ncbi:maltose O-acetyltransferase [Nocardioides sp. BE266]|uniref:acyltransferase n=1 Tax=Nocardioides sp. BE266 TaxID=2817725 RepID=UPI0028575BB0|nr:acyltransferase [Nocardioides sp. BE266]MDR7252080.1 maltose O-acetyltransferase [Nocardioides sp. BE266]
MIPHRPRFARHGSRFFFDPSGTYSYGNVSVGYNVNLGHRPTLIAAQSRIIIGDNVMFGPDVSIFGGGHNISVVGTPMIDVIWKRGDEDLGVSIGNDVWIGTRAVILRGVDVGTGSVVAGGAVVSKSVPDYAIVAGNPARVVGHRFTLDEAISHETQMYGLPSSERLETLRIMIESDAMLPRRQVPL